jgi:hypothetical protein
VRRRYVVVLLGTGGSVRSQRAELSKQRSEADAQAAARRERARLSHLRPEAARNYRVVVEFDGRPLDDALPVASNANGGAVGSA